MISSHAKIFLIAKNVIGKYKDKVMALSLVNKFKYIFDSSLLSVSKLSYV